MEGIATGQADFAEVEVDTETGHVEILNLVMAHDFGTAVNPTMVENQMIGGAIQGGIGFVMRESLVTDPATGAVLNSNWLNYKIHTALDIPPMDPAPIIVEMPATNAPYGIKGEVTQHCT